MAQFIYTGELKLDRNHVLKSIIRRRLVTHFVTPIESERLEARHYSSGSFYESGHLDKVAAAMGQQIFESLPRHKLPAGILIEQNFRDDARLLLLKQGIGGYKFEITTK